MKYLFLLLIAVCTCYAAQRGITHGAPEVYQRLPTHKRSTIQDGEITVTLGLKQRNVDKLEQMFWAVSDPHNPSYGKHLDLAGIKELVAPSQETTATVIDWLSSKGVEVELSGANDFIKAHMTVAQAESIFQAPQTAYAHKRNGKVVASMDEGYVLPDHVSDLVDFVSHFNPVRNTPDIIPEPSQPTRSLTPARVTRTTSNAPIIGALATADGGFTLDAVFIFCIDGSNPTINVGSLTCSGGSSFSTLDGVVTNNITGVSLGSVSFGLSCELCSDDANCKKSTFDQHAVLCGTAQQTSGIPNYVPWTLSLTTTWSDSSRSSPFVSNVMESCEDATPSVISRAYNIPAGTKVTSSQNSQAVVEFSESFLLSDATKYFSEYSLPDMTNLIQVVNTQYVNDASPGAGEGILDVDCIMGTARNCKTLYWGNSNYVQDTFLTWITDVLNSNTPPLVHSVSWGGPEIDPFVSDPNYNTRSNIEFMKAGLRGITIIVSSGDAGPQFVTNSTFPGYSPDYPASSPYVTSVGATVFAAASHDPSCYNSGGAYTCAVAEQACSFQNGAIISSGGGFSNRFNRPSYQDTVVSAYVRTITQAQISAGVNISGRGYPDVAAIGHNLPIFYNGQLGHFDGTSASSPIFAGMVTLWNDIRLTQGKNPLGFLNPFLYSLDPSNFNDVTLGSNNCVATGCSVNGFSASTGWDAVTGLGSPNFHSIATVVGALPDTTPAPTTASVSTSSTPSSTTSTPASTTSTPASTSSPSSTSTASQLTVFLAASVFVILF